MNDETSVNDKYGEILEFNGAIVAFTREKVIEVLALAELHRQVAAKYDEVADQLRELAATSAQLIGDALVVEMGLSTDEDEEGDDEDDD